MLHVYKTILRVPFCTDDDESERRHTCEDATA